MSVQNENGNPVSRRSLLKLIGTTAGSAMLYETMVAMGYAGESDFSNPIKLSGDVKGATVLVLGAGLAGMTAAYELRKAGYKVQVLEYNDRPGGRNWSLHGGDSYTEMGGVTQKITFDKGLYFNPGPWRIPYHHRGSCITARNSGSSSNPSTWSTTTPMCIRPGRSAASPSAIARSRRISTAISASFSPRPRRRTSWTAR
jgi:monoamine oxidase